MWRIPGDSQIALTLNPTDTSWRGLQTPIANTVLPVTAKRATSCVPRYRSEAALRRVEPYRLPGVDDPQGTSEFVVRNRTVKKPRVRFAQISKRINEGWIEAMAVVLQAVRLRLGRQRVVRDHRLLDLLDRKNRLGSKVGPKHIVDPLNEL